MDSKIKIGRKTIGKTSPTFIVAEMSANHNQSFNKAVEIIKEAKKNGADAIKIQTYTADSITLDSDSACFYIKGTQWDGKKLYDLYREAYTPWEWQPKLKKIADDLGLEFFSTPFDLTSVDFLEKMDVPAYKIASFELVDIPLITKIAQTGKPIILSTGMASLGEIEEAVKTIRQTGNEKIILLKCTSAYPALPEEANLKTIPHLNQTFGVPSGLSDHTMGSAVAIAAVAIGACVIEKHFTLSRDDDGPDSSFSMAPNEFGAMVRDIRMVEKALGSVFYELTEKQKESINFRRSLFLSSDIKAGEIFTENNIKSIRPAYGLHTRYYNIVLGKKAKTDLKYGTPLSWEMICE